MPTGVYDRALRDLSLEEFLLYLLRQSQEAMHSSDLYDHVRHRMTNRRYFSVLMRSLVRDGRVVQTVSHSGGTLYALPQEG
jgi:hypothetical protein